MESGIGEINRGEKMVSLTVCSGCDDFSWEFTGNPAWGDCGTAPCCKVAQTNPCQLDKCPNPNRKKQRHMAREAAEQRERRDAEFLDELPKRTMLGLFDDFYSIAEREDQKSAEECWRYDRLRDEIRKRLGGDDQPMIHIMTKVEGPYKYCTDCGCEMVWSNPVHPTPTWMCPSCVYDRMKSAEAEVKRLSKLLD